jgi:hypothetical protein
MSDDGPGEWVEKTAFVMPLLPAEVDVDPVVAALLHCTAFLELSGDEDVDPDRAVEAMEHVAAYLQRLPEDRTAALAGQFARVRAFAEKQGAPEEFLDFVDGFLENFAGAESSDDE